MQFNLIKKPVIFGVSAGLLLVFFYFSVLSFFQSSEHAFQTFYELWYFIVPLVIGFSLQVFLFSFIKQQIKEKNLRGAGGEVAASGGVSGISMVACCAHHIIDIAPLLGLSFLFVFLSKYQIFFLILAVLSNAFGIILMMEIIKKINLGAEFKIFRKTNPWNWRAIKTYGAFAFIVILASSLFLIKGGSYASLSDVKDNYDDSIKLGVVENSAGGLGVEVEPIDFSFLKPVQLKITFNTHQGDLDFNLTKISYIMDEKGKKYFPERWEGGSGGHHLAGTLYFSSPVNDTKTMKFVIENVYNIEKREFLWQL